MDYFDLTQLLAQLAKTSIDDALSGLDNLAFFSLMKEFLDAEIAEFGENMLGRMMILVTTAAGVLVTIWVTLQGYRIVTGRSREPMTGLVVSGARAVMIVGIATGTAIGGTTMYDTVSSGMTKSINWVFTGERESPYETIDQSLALAQVAMSSIDMLDVGQNTESQQKKKEARWMAGLGIGGPAVTAGTGLLLSKLAIALLMGVAPFFIMCLLFEQTKGLFQGWLYYTLGTLFAVAFLNVTVLLTMDMSLALSAAFWSTKGLQSWLSIGDSGQSEGISSLAMMQGTLGLVMTALIISAPPMAAALFKGVMANYLPYSQMGNSRPSAVSPEGRAMGVGQNSTSQTDTAKTTPGTPSPSVANPALSGTRTGAVQPSLADEIRKN